MFMIGEHMNSGHNPKIKDIVLLLGLSQQLEYLRDTGLKTDWEFLR